MLLGTKNFYIISKFIHFNPYPSRHACMRMPISPTGNTFVRSGRLTDFNSLRSMRFNDHILLRTTSSKSAVNVCSDCAFLLTVTVTVRWKMVVVAVFCHRDSLQKFQSHSQSLSQCVSHIPDIDNATTHNFWTFCNQTLQPNLVWYLVVAVHHRKLECCVTV